jgi:adenosylhomocysteine nucleosidase
VSAPVDIVVAPMPEELAPLRACLARVRRLHLGLPGTWTGLLDGAPVALAVTGDGARAAAATQRLLRALPVRRMLVIGVAGALSPDLGLGALVASARVRRADEAGAGAAPDQALLAAAVGVAGARPGVLVTARRLADTAVERRRLLAAIPGADARGGGRGSLAAAVDTESAALVAGAVEAAVPWVVVRAISDTADEALPALLNRCRDEHGAIRRVRVARALVLRPIDLPALLALRSRVERCAQALAVAARRLLLAPVSLRSVAEAW